VQLERAWPQARLLTDSSSVCLQACCVADMPIVASCGGTSCMRLVDST
jgi:hypothetical protein